MAAAVLAVACGDKDGGPVGGEAKKYSVEAIPTSSSDPWEWTYVTLDDGATVDAADDWDIAISRYRLAEIAIRTNSGTSGPGSGGVVMAGGEVQPDSERPISYMAMGPQGPGIGTMNISWSGVEAVDFSFEVMPPQYTMLPASTFRSADGERFYKVQFTGYLNDEGQPGYLTFEVTEVYL